MAVTPGLGPQKTAGVRTMSFQIPGHLAATATELVSCWECDADFKVTAMHVMPTTAVTGADTNTTHLNIMDGATEKANMDLVSGTDLAAHTAAAFTVTAWTLNDGDHLNVQIEKVGTGLLVPSWSLVVEGQYQ